MEVERHFNLLASESIRLLPANAKDRVSILFPIYSGFKNISPTISEAKSATEKTEVSLPEKKTIIIQVGAYKDILNAKKDAKKLEEKGFKWQIKQGKLNTLYLISEGNDKDKEELKKILKKEGFNI